MVKMVILVIKNHPNFSIFSPTFFAVAFGEYITKLQPCHQPRITDPGNWKKVV